MDDAAGMKLIEYLGSKGAKAACPLCGHDQWLGGQIVAASPVDEAGNVQIGGTIVPMAQLVCGNCSYVLMFAARPAGLI